MALKSPIARGFFALGRLTEWAHRRIHGPQFAPGDVVQLSNERGRFVPDTRMTLDCRELYYWVSTCGLRIYEDEIVRVVRYTEGVHSE